MMSCAVSPSLWFGLPSKPFSLGNVSENAITALQGFALAAGNWFRLASADIHAAGPARQAGNRNVFVATGPAEELAESGEPGMMSGSRREPKNRPGVSVNASA
jgi:hypothetical protein